MKHTTCGFIAQHDWELPVIYPEMHEALCSQLDTLFRFLITERNIRHFSLTLETGLSLDAAEALLALRRQYPLQVECVIPYEEQHAQWSEEERDRYFRIVSQADKESMVQHHFSLDCYRQAVRRLVGSSTSLLAIWSGLSSDTGDAISLARKSGKDVMVIDPTGLLQAEKRTH